MCVRVCVCVCVCERARACVCVRARVCERASEPYTEKKESNCQTKKLKPGQRGPAPRRTGLEFLL
jgi:hypothetical protein